MMPAEALAEKYSTIISLGMPVLGSVLHLVIAAIMTLFGRFIPPRLKGLRTFNDVDDVITFF